MLTWVLPCTVERDSVVRVRRRVVRLIVIGVEMVPVMVLRRVVVVERIVEVVL